jgi:hypothetical protein
LKRKKGECAACLKNSAHIFVEKIHKIGCLEGRGVPVLYIGRAVPQGYSINTLEWKTSTLKTDGVDDR